MEIRSNTHLSDVTETWLEVSFSEAIVPETTMTCISMYKLAFDYVNLT